MQNQTINGRYRILQQIGVGGFGLTYLAEDLHLPTRPKCVVKHLKPQISDPETLHLANRLFQQEAEILYRLGSHPQIPSLIAHFKENGEFYLVQEYIEGHTVAQELNGGRRFEQKEMVRLLGQTLEILAFVHGQKVIHRDVKPANLIRRSSDGSIFLIDFGAVKQVSSFPQTPQHSTFSTLTIGSHGYMPTEQMAGKPNFSSDLYALGLIAIESVTGVKPLELRQNAQTNEFIWTGKTELSPELQHFVAKLVRYDFRQRFYSANEALQALNVIAGRAGFFKSTPVAAPAPVQQSSLAVSAITLTPIANAHSSPTAVAGSNGPGDSYIPPTVIVSNEAAPGRQFQSLQPIRGNFTVPLPPDEKEMSLGGKIALFAGLTFVLVAGFVIAARSIVKSAQPEIEIAQTRPSDSAKSPDSAGPGALVTSSDGSAMLFEEATKQVAEAQQMERKASTQFDWNLIANKYNRAHSLLASIEPGTSFYDEAQARMQDLRRRADNAAQKANAASAGGSSVTPEPTIVPATETTVPAPAAPTATPRRSVSMPPKLSATSYITFSYFDGYAVRDVRATSEDALFRAVLERGSSEKSDSKVLNFEIRGGAFSGWLKFKPPTGTAKLSAGNYSSVREVSYQPSGNYGLTFTHMSCWNDASHSFRINNIAYNDLYSTVSLFDATFVLNCGNKKMMGRIRYDAR